MLALALLAMLAPRQDPPVDTFSSPSGAWTLTVTRKEKEWNGVVELVLVHDGVEAWRVEHELGLREACVGDDGRVAGFGYTGEGGAEHASRPDGPRGGTLRVFVLNENGGLLLDESHARRQSQYPDGSPTPAPAGVLLIPDLRRFIVRVFDEDLNRGAEAWWSYDIATGAALPRVRPKLALGLEDAVRGPAGVRAVPGTALVLLHWWRSEWKPRALGSRFQLVDADMRAVWTLDLPHDLDSLGEHELRRVREHGNLVSTSDHAFELRLVADAAIVGYALERAADGWTVTETARRPDPDAQPAKKAKPRAR